MLLNIYFIIGVVEDKYQINYGLVCYSYLFIYLRLYTHMYIGGLNSKGHYVPVYLRVMQRKRSYLD